MQLIKPQKRLQRVRLSGANRVVLRVAMMIKPRGIRRCVQIRPWIVVDIGQQLVDIKDIDRRVWPPLRHERLIRRAIVKYPVHQLRVLEHLILVLCFVVERLVRPVLVVACAAVALGCVQWCKLEGRCIEQDKAPSAS